MIKQKVALYLDPPSHHFLKDKLFENEQARYVGENLMDRYIYLRDFLRTKGIPVRTTDFLSEHETEAVQNIYMSLGMLSNYKRLAKRKDTVLSAFFAMECPIVDPSLYRALKDVQKYFKRIFSWSDSQSLEHFVGAPICVKSFHLPQSFDRVHESVCGNTERKFLIMMNSNKLSRSSEPGLYVERLRAVDYFSRRGEIDLYGKWWNHPPIRVGNTRIPRKIIHIHRIFLTFWQRINPDPLLESARRSYRGLAESKSEILGNYTFAICFENAEIKGYVTEKIFDCFFAGTIPIYLGAPDIETYIPPECFINMRDFASYEELRTFLRSLSEEEIRNYKVRACEFLRSPEFQPFSKKAFAELFFRIIKEDTGLSLS